jgi:hypothetical protein
VRRLVWRDLANSPCQLSLAFILECNQTTPAVGIQALPCNSSTHGLLCNGMALSCLTQVVAPKLTVIFPTVMDGSNGTTTSTSSGGFGSVPFGP